MSEYMKVPCGSGNMLVFELECADDDVVFELTVRDGVKILDLNMPFSAIADVWLELSCQAVY